VQVSSRFELVSTFKLIKL